MDIKPLGHKSYGSIPHLPGSRLGAGDHHITIGQAIIATEKKRDRHDRIIVQEKLDGSNVSVAKLNGEIYALIRAGYQALDSKRLQHLLFHNFVQANKRRFEQLLDDGERICGEWLAQAHGTRYELPHEPFVAFDIMKGNERLSHYTFNQRVSEYEFITPRLIHIGEPLSIEGALQELTISGHGAIDPVEGAIWRVERKGAVDFLTKYVRQDKEDGKYLPEISDKQEIWNINIHNYLNQVTK